MRSPCTATKSSPRSPQLEKACAQQQRPNTAKNKFVLKSNILHHEHSKDKWCHHTTNSKDEWHHPDRDTGRSRPRSPSQENQPTTFKDETALGKPHNTGMRRKQSHTPGTARDSTWRVREAAALGPQPGPPSLQFLQREDKSPGLWVSPPRLPSRGSGYDRRRGGAYSYQGWDPARQSQQSPSRNPNQWLRVPEPTRRPSLTRELGRACVCPIQDPNNEPCWPGACSALCLGRELIHSPTHLTGKPCSQQHVVRAPAGGQSRDTGPAGQGAWLTVLFHLVPTQESGQPGACMVAPRARAGKPTCRRAFSSPSRGSSPEHVGNPTAQGQWCWSPSLPVCRVQPGNSLCGLDWSGSPGDELRWPWASLAASPRPPGAVPHLLLSVAPSPPPRKPDRRRQATQGHPTAALRQDPSPAQLSWASGTPTPKLSAQAAAAPHMHNSRPHLPKEATSWHVQGPRLSWLEKGYLCKVWTRPFTQMRRYQHHEPRITKNQLTMMPPKETNKAPYRTLKKWRSMNCRARIQNNPLKEVSELQESTDN